MQKVGELISQTDFEVRFSPKWQKNGHISIANFVLYKKDLSVGAKVIYWYLLSRCFGNKHSCFMSIHTIAFDLQISNKTIIKYKKELEAHKLLLVERRGRGKTNIYTLKF